MPAPSAITYSLDALIAAHQEVADLIDGGAGAGKILLRNSSDTLLAEIPLDDPCGTVSPSTGRLTLDIAGPDTSANAAGTVAYAEICDSDDTVVVSMPAQQGSTAVSGSIVMNTLVVTAGGPVNVISASLG
jgi:hypothetical protein